MTHVPQTHPVRRVPAAVVLALTFATTGALAGAAVAQTPEAAPDAVSQAPLLGLDGLGAPTTLADVAAGALLLKTERAGVWLPAPTVETDVVVRVAGLVARTRLSQTFHNPTSAWVEGVYAFPLPDGAAVDTLRMRVGARVVDGEIREREAARAEYEQARAEGRRASLVEQERPNLFTTSVANLGPDERMEVTIEYQELLRWDAGRIALRFPMTSTPRYRPDGSPTTGAEALVPRRPAPAPGEPVPSPVFVDVELDAGVPLRRLSSPSHAVLLERSVEGRPVRVAAGPLVADRDFVLEWEPRRGAVPRAAVFTQEVDGRQYAMAVVIPPDPATAPRVPPREVIFVLDTSGSMAGGSIEQARASLELALRRLRPEDAFNVLEFDDETRLLFPSPVPATPPAVEEAVAWVRTREAEGGTEMRGALEAALRGQEDGYGELRQVVFVTDGAVGNEEELFRSVERDLGRSRLFTVGIGAAPNSWFMRKAAERGRGTFTFVGTPEEVGPRMEALFRKLEGAVITDVEAAWSDPGAEAWPRTLPDLYLGEPLVVIARLEALGGSLALSGQGETDVWREWLPLLDDRPAVGLDRLWARRKIEALETDLWSDPEAARAAVVAVALEHHLVSTYTSLVAVDRTPAAPPGTLAAPRLLPVTLPAGWDPELFGVLPQGGTASRLWLVAALLLLAAAGVTAIAGRPRLGEGRS